MSHRHAAISAALGRDGLDPVKLAVRFSALEQIEHSLHKIVDIQQLKLGGRVVYRIRLIVCDSPAEGRHGAVVFRSAVTHKIRETIDRNLCAGLLAVSKKQLLPRLFAPAVLAVSEASRKRRLDRRREHYGRGISMLFECIEQHGGKSEIALHKFIGILRTVYTGKIKYKISPTTIFIKLRLGGIKIIFKYLLHTDVGSCSVFSVANISEIVAKRRSDHSLCTGNQDIHNPKPFICSWLYQPFFLHTILLTTPV